VFGTIQLEEFAEFSGDWNS